MSKELKLSFILFFALSCVVIAWKTLSNFFGGVAINFIGIVGLLFGVVLLCIKNKEIVKRIRDLFVVSLLLIVLEMIVYFACEFGYGELLFGFFVYQNVISFIAILFLAYLMFRFILEIQNKQLKWIEFLLGNVKLTSKVRKAKELSNGCLQEKPNCSHTETKENNAEEVEITIETEE